ncbi:rosmarinate synthase [Phtheirospermum japonicum]|uniref:Rosmarinate synthase n=1 Tax=Phtheirospermum japonicum TaxID=374723 RepID=A0A830CIA4_9LAMI|nr:rosmarinate synthase [Phtheirospermum japonicum]
MKEAKRKGKAVVVGGSIAGLSCAHALIAAGWEVVVLEKASSPPTGCATGAGLGLDPLSQKLIQSWLKQPHTLELNTLPLTIDQNQATYGDKKINRILTRDEDFNFRAAYWSDLHSLLYKSLPAHIVRWGHMFLSFIISNDKTRGNSVTMKMSDDMISKMHEAAESSLLPELANVIRETKEPFLNVIYDSEPLDRIIWDNVVLIGDAAHPTTPHGLRSTNMSISDAAILGKCLEKWGVENLNSALQEYQSIRVPVTSEQVLFSRRLGLIKQGLVDRGLLDPITAGREECEELRQKNMPFLLDVPDILSIDCAVSALPVLYYDFPTRRRPGELTKKLIESISVMLCAYPIITGRLLRTPDGRWAIKFNDAGVRMVEAKVKGSVDEWLQNVDREKELKLITEFEGGGLAIGLSCTHLLSDPISATMMIKAWADTTLRGEITSPPLFHPLPRRKQEINENTNNLKLNSHLINHYKSAIQNLAPISHTKQTTIALRFNHGTVKSCIAMAGNTNDDEPNTPFEALAALFWTRISKIKGTTKNALVDMSICLDMRKVLKLDKGFFGNCMAYNSVQGDGLDANEVSKAAGFIREAISRMDGDDEVTGLIEWLEHENYENPPCMNGSHLICADLGDVDSYSAVFEDNVGPIRVSYYFEPAVGPGQIVILPSSGGDGPSSRVIAVTLPEDEAEELLEDALIKQFEPTILMGLLNKRHS